MMNRRRPAVSWALLLLAALAAPATAQPDPRVFPIDTTPGQWLPRNGYQALAADDSGRHSLAVYAVTDTTAGCRYATVVGVLLDSGGVLTPEGISLGVAGGRRSWTAVCFGDESYLVVWTDTRLDPDGDIFAARVSRNGEVLDDTGFAICRAPGQQYRAAVGRLDSGWLVVWEDRRTGNSDVVGARVNWRGEVLDPLGITIAASPGEQSEPTVASGREGCVVCWLHALSGDAAVFVRRVDNAGGLPGQPLRVAGDRPGGIVPSLPKIAFNGTEFVVTWLHQRECVYCRWISPNLDTMRAATIIQSAYIPHTVLCSRDSAVLVCWQHNGSVYTAFLTPPGSISPPQLVSTGARQDNDPTVCLTSYGHLVAWWLAINYAGTMVARWVVPPARLTDPFRVARLARLQGWQRNARAAAGPGGFCVVWQSAEPYSSTNASARLLDRDGGGIDNSLTPIGYFRGVPDSSPAVAAGEDAYLTLQWTRYSDNIANVVPNSGPLRDRAPFRVGSASSWFDVSSDGRNFLVVKTPYVVRGTRVRSTGELVGPVDFGIDSAYPSPKWPTAASDGQHYLVVWCAANGSDCVFGKRVDTAGTVIDPYPHLYGIVRTNSGGADVAWGDTIYLVAWSYYTGSRFHIRGIRVRRDGTPIEATPLAISDSLVYCPWASPPRVCFDGANFIVVWASEGSWSDTASVRGAVVGIDGVVNRRFSFRTVSQRVEDIYPDVACRPGGRALIVFTDVCIDRPEPVLGQYQVYGVFVDQLVGVEEAERAGGVPVPSASPSPFRSRVTLRFGPAARAGAARALVLDRTGRLVRSLCPDDAGVAAWDGRDAAGAELPSGVYFCRLAGGTTPTTLRVIKAR